MCTHVHKIYYHDLNIRFPQRRSRNDNIIFNGWNKNVIKAQIHFLNMEIVHMSYVNDIVIIIFKFYSLRIDREWERKSEREESAFKYIFFIVVLVCHQPSSSFFHTLVSFYREPLSKIQHIAFDNIIHLFRNIYVFVFYKYSKNSWLNFIQIKFAICNEKIA